MKARLFMQYRKIGLIILGLLLILGLGSAYWLFVGRTQNDPKGLLLSDFDFLHQETRLDEVLDRLGEPDRILGQTTTIERHQYDLVDGRVVELIFGYGPLQASILEENGTRKNYFEVVGEAVACEKVASIEVIPDLISSLEDPDPVVRKESAQALGCIGKEATTAIPALTQTLGDEKKWVRIAAAWALGRIGPEAIPSLTQALENQDANIRAAAAWGLGYIGSEANESIPVLIQALGDEDETVCQAAAWALGGIGSAAVPTLIQVLEDKDLDADLRKYAAIALGQAGTEAEEAIPNLILALEDENEEVRTGAKIALWYITGHPVSDVNWWKEWWESQQ
jgi:3-methyladenine DNA glycosylase AlkD